MENNVDIATKIKTNKEEFLNLLSTIERLGIERLTEWINKSDFFVAPASTRFHSNYDGGLCEHSLLVYKIFKQKNDHYDFGLAEDTVKIVTLLHDLCKANFYKPSTRNKKDDNGKWIKVPFYEIQDQFPIGHGDKSVIMLQNFIALKREEILMIRWHMGGYVNKDDYNSVSAAWGLCKPAVCLHTADLEASYIFEEHIDY